MVGGNALAATTVYLEDIDSGLTSPTGNYRWLDVADQAYSAAYQNDYNYTQANVRVDYDIVASGLQGTLHATNLKPNFAYQLKLVGFAGTATNEAIGLAGRWWREEWNSALEQWTNGTNSSDSDYYAKRYIEDLSSPTGYHYKFTGYLLFDYFITNGNGEAELIDFLTDSSYHVLWKTTQRTPYAADGPVKETRFDADNSPAYYDTGGDDYFEKTVQIYGEIERPPVGGVSPNFANPVLAQLILTEESFHGSGGALAGSWAGAMGGIVSECNNNDICDYSENCDNCPNDCISGDYGGVCGNGVCEPNVGEDCLSCPSDCRGKQKGASKMQYCCGDGDGVNPADCTDTRCIDEGYSCSDNLSESYCCGDLVCEGDEDSYNCEMDCGPPPVCEDGSCDPSEDQCTCPVDCGTPPSNETNCSDGLDNDCDGLVDSDDTSDCACFSKRETCTLDSECCSNWCHRGACK